MSDKKQEAKQQESIEYSPALKKLMEDAIMAAVVAAKSTQAPAPQQMQLEMPAVMPREISCGECGQARRACGGKHRQVLIAPSNPNWFSDFPGIKLNGVKYRSERPDQYVTIPADFNAEGVVQAWEEAEHKLRFGNGRKGAVRHG